MKMEQEVNLLNKYYKGETSLEEEERLKGHFLNDESFSPEKDAFEYYNKEATLPDGLEEEIFNAIQNSESRKRAITRRLISISSLAASIVIVLGIYINSRNQKIRDLENSFFVMEQAMYQVSETLQPQQQEDMFVLWVDDNVEIIIN